MIDMRHQQHASTTDIIPSTIHGYLRLLSLLSGGVNGDRIASIKVLDQYMNAWALLNIRYIQLFTGT